MCHSVKYVIEFFFFKQKTAYKRCIIDWSSDVCSSDLRDGLVRGNEVWNVDSYGNPAYGNDRSADGIYVDGGRDILIEGNTIHDVNIGIELASEHAGTIGRASSRDRVCPYV